MPEPVEHPPIQDVPVISAEAHLAIDDTILEALQFQEMLSRSGFLMFFEVRVKLRKGPLKKVVQEILSDAAAKRLTTKELTGMAARSQTWKVWVLRACFAAMWRSWWSRNGLLAQRSTENRRL